MTGTDYRCSCIRQSHLKRGNDFLVEILHRHGGDVAKFLEDFVGAGNLGVGGADLAQDLEELVDHLAGDEAAGLLEWNSCSYRYVSPIMSNLKTDLGVHIFMKVIWRREMRVSIAVRTSQ